MTEAFADRVYPLLRHVLEMATRGRKGAAAAEDIAMLRDYLASIDATGIDERDWALARFAILAWLDEATLDVRQPQVAGAAGPLLRDNSLPTENLPATFLTNASLARDRESTDATETYLWCAALGYRAPFRGAMPAAGAADVGSLEDWSRLMYKRLKQPPKNFEPLAPMGEFDPDADALPLTGRAMRRGRIVLVLTMASVSALMFAAWMAVRVMSL